MFLVSITTQQQLNTFVTEQPSGQFLQSWEWGEFQQASGRAVWRFGVVAGEHEPAEQLPEYDIISHGELTAVATIVEHRLGPGMRYLYCPAGPVFVDHPQPKVLHEVTQALVQQLEREVVRVQGRSQLAVRFEPRLTATTCGNTFALLSAKKTHALQPQDTVVVDLLQDEKKLLMNQHSKTRYNIRLAQRRGVTVRVAHESQDIDIFWELLCMTSERNEFHVHTKDHYKQLWQHFRFSDVANQMEFTVKLFVAEYEHKPIAAIMVGFFGATAVYMHGASNYEYRAVMAPYALQWEAMRHAKKMGYHWYDLYGITPTHRAVGGHEKESGWAGVTRFKLGFGGDEMHYVGTWDYVYQPMAYRIYEWIRTLRQRLPF